MVSYNFGKGVSHSKHAGLLPILQPQNDLGPRVQNYDFMLESLLPEGSDWPMCRARLRLHGYKSQAEGRPSQRCTIRYLTNRIKKGWACSPPFGIFFLLVYSCSYVQVLMLMLMTLPLQHILFPLHYVEDLPPCCHFWMQPRWLLGFGKFSQSPRMILGIRKGILLWWGQKLWDKKGSRNLCPTHFQVSLTTCMSDTMEWQEKWVSKVLLKIWGKTNCFTKSKGIPRKGILI